MEPAEEIEHVGMIFSEKDFSGVDFTENTFEDCVFERCDFKAAVLSRARNRRHVHLLMDRGIEAIVRDTFHSSLRLSELVLEALQVPPERAARAVELFRAHDERLLAEHRQGAVTGGAVGHALVFQLVFTLQAEVAMARAGGNDDGRRLDAVPVHRENKRASG